MAVEIKYKSIFKLWEYNVLIHVIIYLNPKNYFSISSKDKVHGKQAQLPRSIAKKVNFPWTK